jgi:hypothetical protein
MEIRQELMKAVIKMGFQEIDNSLDKNDKYYQVNDDSVTIDHYNYQMDRFAMYAVLILRTYKQMVDAEMSKNLFISSVALVIKEEFDEFQEKCENCDFDLSEDSNRAIEMRSKLTFYKSTSDFLHTLV